MTVLENPDPNCSAPVYSSTEFYDTYEVLKIASISSKDVDKEIDKQRNDVINIVAVIFLTSVLFTIIGFTIYRRWRKDSDKRIYEQSDDRIVILEPTSQTPVEHLPQPNAENEESNHLCRSCASIRLSKSLTHTTSQEGFPSCNDGEIKQNIFENTASKENTFARHSRGNEHQDRKILPVECINLFELRILDISALLCIGLCMYVVDFTLCYAINCFIKSHYPITFDYSRNNPLFLLKKSFCQKIGSRFMIKSLSGCKLNLDYHMSGSKRTRPGSNIGKMSLFMTSPSSQFKRKQSCSVVFLVLLSILLCTVGFNPPKSESSTCKLAVELSEHSLKKSSKLYYLLQEGLGNIKYAKSMHQFCKELQFRPETLCVAYPMYRPGVGPNIDRFLSPDPPRGVDAMCVELLRVCTFFNFPAFMAISCLRLAKAGFFYSGNADEVTCFSCNVKISGWNMGRDPMTVHRERSPECTYLNYIGQGNVRAGASAPAPITGPSETTPSVTDTSPQANSSSNRTNSSSGYGTGSGSSEKPLENAGKDFSTSASGDTASNAATASVAAANNAETAEISMPSEESKKPSSDTNRSNSSSPSRSTSPPEISTSQPSEPSRSDRDSQLGSNNPTISRPSAGYRGTADPARSRAFYPDYVLPADRLKTFDNWPADIRQTPQQMVESGFFYAGYEDCVRCFQCGIGLRNWEPPDNPHVEHARWSPRCAFLLRVKGTDFINLVMDAVAQLAQRRRNPPEESTSSQSSNNNTVTTTSQAQRSAGQSHDTESKQASSATSSNSKTQTSTCGAASVQSVSVDAAASETSSEANAKTVKDATISESQSEKGAKNTGNDASGTTVKKQKEKPRGPGLLGGHQSSMVSPPKDDEMERMKRENREMRDRTICKICLEAQVSIAFIPCGHLVACSQCAHAITRCAMCRKPISNKILTNMDV